MSKGENKMDRPKIVCLCGSTRFWREYMDVAGAEALANHIVLSVGFFVNNGSGAPWLDAHKGITADQKAALDELHLRKIDLADEVLILNVNGYVGESTRNEIAYALAHKKPVRYLEAPREEALAR
jgi:hypothetical protein